MRKLTERYQCLCAAWLLTSLSVRKALGFRARFMRAGLGTLALQLGFEVFNRWQAALKLFWQGLGNFIFRNAYGLAKIAQRVFRHDLILRFAKNNPDTRLVA